MLPSVVGRKLGSKALKNVIKTDNFQRHISWHLLRWQMVPQHHFLAEFLATVRMARFCDARDQSARSRKWKQDGEQKNQFTSLTLFKS